MADPHDAGYRMALAFFLNRAGDCDWVVLYPDGAFRMSEIGEPCGPIPLDATIDTIVIHRPACRPGQSEGDAWHAELERRLAIR